MAIIVLMLFMATLAVWQSGLITDNRTDTDADAIDGETEFRADGQSVERLVPTSQEPASNQPVASPLAVPNSAFQVPTDDELKRIDLVLQQTFFPSGPPRLYVRHRVAKIDTSELRNQLQESWLLRKDIGVIEPVTVPLFDDNVVQIEIDAWIHGGFGIVSAYGRVSGQAAGQSVDFHFSDDGGLEAGLSVGNLSYMIAPVAEQQYFIVMEMLQHERID